MKKQICIVLILSILVTSCSGSLSLMNVDNKEVFYAQANRICERYSLLVIKMDNNEEIICSGIKINSDSTSYTQIAPVKENKIATSTIKEIYYDIKEGVVKRGILTGAVAGIGIGFLLTSVTSAAKDGGINYIVLGFLGLFVIGGLIGGIVGTINEQPSTIIFKE